MKPEFFLFWLLVACLLWLDARQEAARFSTVTALTPLGADHFTLRQE